jgi:hypothetical protein
MRQELLTTLTGGLIFASCTTVGVTPMKANIVARPSTCFLDVYSNEKEIERPFEVVCLIDARTGTSTFHNTTGAGAINAARPYACECGADGILVMSSNVDGDGFWIPRTGVATIKAIRYKAENSKK